MLAVNEDIRNSSLLGDLEQVVLDLSAIRDGVDFQDVGLVGKSRNGALGLGTVRAVVLGEDHHGVLFDQVVNFSFGSVGNHSGRGKEVTSEGTEHEQEMRVDTSHRCLPHELKTARPRRDSLMTTEKDVFFRIWVEAFAQLPTYF